MTETWDIAKDVATVVLGGMSVVVPVVLLLWTNSKPTIVARDITPDKKYKTSQETIFTFQFMNKARRPLRYLGVWKKRNQVLHEVSAQIFFPDEFLIRAITRQKAKTITVTEDTPPMPNKYVFEAPASGRYKDKRYSYVFVPDPFDRKPPVMTSLSDAEPEECRIDVRMPACPGTYEIIADISSREGGETKTISIKVENP